MWNNQDNLNCSVDAYPELAYKCDEIDIVHEREAYHGDNLREGTVPPDASRDDSYEQIGNKYYPRLYLYCVDAVSIEEMQREVLL